MPFLLALVVSFKEFSSLIFFWDVLCLLLHNVHQIHAQITSNKWIVCVQCHNINTNAVTILTAPLHLRSLMKIGLPWHLYKDLN